MTEVRVRSKSSRIPHEGGQRENTRATTHCIRIFPPSNPAYPNLKREGDAEGP